MRVATFVLVVCLGVAELAAFDGNEHRFLSNAAVLTARRLAGATLGHTMSAAIDDRLAAGFDFGQVTLAVDWFQGPEKLAFARDADWHLRRREASWFMRGLALHQNSKHFQMLALQAWQRHHTCAIEFAKTNREADALLSEAVALHYLQDFLSAGHVTTPRRGMHDAAAGSFHDAFNTRGVDFFLPVELPDVAGEALQGLASGGFVQQDDLDEFHRVRSLGPATFQGDGSLESRRVQRTFVLIASTLSVLEVLTAKEEPTWALQACFLMRTALSDKERPSTANARDFLGPQGGIRVGDPGEARVCEGCDGPAWLGQYAVEDHPALTRDFLDLSGVILRGQLGTGAGEWRFNLDGLLLLFCQDPDGSLRDRRTGKMIRNPVALPLNGGGGGLSYSLGERYRALGLQYDYMFGTRSDLLSVGYHVVIRRYWGSGAQTTRVDYGGKASLGFQVFNIVAAVDRGRYADATGRFRSAWFVSAGADLVLSSSWRKLLKRQKK